MGPDEMRFSKPNQVSIQLCSGTLLVMKECANCDWLHKVAPANFKSTPRINLTFRIANKI